MQRKTGVRKANKLDTGLGISHIGEDLFWTYSQEANEVQIFEELY